MHVSKSFTSRYRDGVVPLLATGGDKGLQLFHMQKLR